MFSALKHFAHLGHINPEPEKDGAGKIRQIAVFALPGLVYLNQTSLRQEAISTSYVNEGR